MRAILTGLSAALLAGTAHAAGPATVNGRLPSDVVPTAYDLTVDPDATKLSFSGQGSVAIDVRRATRTITLNAADLSIAGVTVDGTIPATVATDAAGQTATFTFASPLTVGAHRLAMRWQGKIYQSATGLFAIDYTNTDGTPDRMLVTQFEAPDARRFAPMWDEPALKATFTLSALAPTGQMAFSNMPVTGRTAGANGKTLWHFATTPKMSSYLLFLGMGNVERKTLQAGKVEIGVITRKGVVDQGDYALASAKRVLAAYDDYFGTPYPLPKMDMIAAPGSSQFFSAMENWGAILYFERVLLQDPKRQTESQKQDIFNVVAHEMAHQWFGDLVTMAWWDDLWLNEGFASWMASKTANDLNPEWGSVTQSAAFDRQNAFSRDARATTHPIIQRVETVDQISQAFDDITYRKGEAVIRMLEGAVGPDAFRDGVRRYMAKYQYGNTVTDQLWAEVGAASASDVKPMMDSFTRQGGVPLIRVSEPACANGRTTAMLTQGRYGLDAASKAPTRWLVPVAVATVGSRTPMALVRTVLRAPAGQPNGVVADGCGPLLVNAGQSAYFRTLYSPNHFERLRTSFGVLPVVDQVGLFADSYGLANSGDAPIERYLSLLDTVPADASPTLWEMVVRELGSVDAVLAGTPAQSPFRAKARRLLAPVFARAGWTARPGEQAALAQLRDGDNRNAGLVETIGRFGDPAVLADANRYAELSFSQPDQVTGGTRQSAQALYAYTADAARWQALRARAKAERSPVGKLEAYINLGGVRDPALALAALELTLGDEVPVPMRGNLLQAVGSEHPALAFDWAVAHEAQVNAFLEASTRAAFIVGLPQGSSDPALASRVDAYAKRALPAGSRGPADTTVAAIRIRAALRDRQQAALAAWAAR